MSKISVYGWIRENVRRAVLLGFSDAVEQLGEPEKADNLNPHLAALLQDKAPRMAEVGNGLLGAEAGTTTKSRKRLGRSLNQIRPSDERSA